MSSAPFIAIMGREQEAAMRNWLIPAIVVLAVNLAGVGVGWSINEWQDSDKPPPTEQSTPPVTTGPTDAELDAQRCAAALEAVGNLDPRLIARYTEFPLAKEIKDASDRYCH